jgi:hypothetical protein
MGGRAPLVAITAAAWAAWAVAGCFPDPLGLAPSTLDESDSGNDATSAGGNDAFAAGNDAFAGDARGDAGGDARADAAGDAGAEASAALPCTTPPGACVASVPAGWTIALLGSGNVAPCPQGFAAADGTLPPQATGPACACSCTLSTPPVCDHGTLQLFFGTAATNCSLPESVTVNGCTALQTPTYPYLKANPLPLTGGACLTSGGVNAASVSAPATRTCAAPTACQEEVCQGRAPAGFSACIFQDGAQTCPAPWVKSTTVVGGYTTTCPACGSCTVTGSCTGAVLMLYRDTLCSQEVASHAIDGNCDPSTFPGVGNTACKYTATVTSPGCNQPAAGDASFTTTGDVTVCCR